MPWSNEHPQTNLNISFAIALNLLTVEIFGEFNHIKQKVFEILCAVWISATNNAENIINNRLLTR